MTFIEKHKKSLIIGVSTFVIGFVSGQVYETYCYHQQLEHKILSQVFSQQEQMKENREEASRTFQAQRKPMSEDLEAMRARHKKSDEERRLRRKETPEKPFGSEHADFLSKIGNKK